jgi:hypothetical protein
MRRLTVLLLPFFGACLLAQPAFSQVKGLIHIGMTGSSFRGGNLQNASPIFRFAGGAGLRYKYPSGFEIESGVDYSVKGAELEGSFEDIPIIGTSEITYLTVPVLVGFRFNQTGRIQPRLVAGPSMSFQTDARISYRAIGGGIEQSTSDEGIGERDLGWVLGVDLDTRFGGETLTSGVRLTLGNSNARTADPELLHTSAYLFLGIVF